MMPELLVFQDKRLEKTIASISAQITDTLEIIQKGRALSTAAETRLIQAYSRLVELYVEINSPQEDI